MIKLNELKADDAVHGKVTRVSVAGAFLDVGAEVEGFVHVSRLSPRSNRVEDVLSAGQELDLWVSTVDPNAGRLELTMIRPVLLKWGKIKPGMQLTGTISRIEKFGAFVDIGAERDGLVHVSEMTDGYVRDPAEVAKVGDQVEVAILEVDRSKKQIRLSMNFMPEEFLEDEGEEEEVPTAMEVALREAMDGASDEPEAEEGPKTADKGRAVQEDLLARTLSKRVKTSTDSDTKKS